MEGRPEHGIERKDPTQLRISDDDRHRVAEVLRHAAGEGRIDFDELDERLEAAYSARTYADLVPITADLPTHSPQGPVAYPRPAPRPSVPAVSHAGSFSIMGDCTRRGVWQVPERHTAFSMMGSVTLDLREAQFTASEVTIDAYAIMAGIDIIVNAYTQVVVEGIGIMGDFSEAKPKVPADLTQTSQVVRVKGMALMAGVSVQRKPMPGESRKRLSRGR